jgi:hypothetical protein
MSTDSALVRTLFQIATGCADLRVKKLEADAEARVRRETAWKSKPCANQFCTGAVDVRMPANSVCTICLRQGPPEVRFAEY